MRYIYLSLNIYITDALHFFFIPTSFPASQPPEEYCIVQMAKTAAISKIKHIYKALHEPLQALDFFLFLNKILIISDLSFLSGSDWN